MYKLPKILSLLIFSLFILCCHAQNKYALVIGINNYYSAPGVLNKENCLHGCLNDAAAMRSLLIHRFGFEEANVVSILNEKAIQRNVIEACFAIMKKCKRGDAFFFYYSGHGVYLENSYLYNDAVKRGFNNALCMTDLYAPNFDCLLRDSTIKRLINRLLIEELLLLLYSIAASAKRWPQNLLFLPIRITNTRSTTLLLNRMLTSARINLSR